MEGEDVQLVFEWSRSSEDDRRVDGCVRCSQAARHPGNWEPGGEGRPLGRCRAMTQEDVFRTNCYSFQNLSSGTFPSVVGEGSVCVQ